MGGGDDDGGGTGRKRKRMRYNVTSCNCCCCSYQSKSGDQFQVVLRHPSHTSYSLIEHAISRFWSRGFVRLRSKKTSDVSHDDRHVVSVEDDRQIKRTALRAVKSKCKQKYDVERNGRHSEK